MGRRSFAARAAVCVVSAAALSLVSYAAGSALFAGNSSSATKTVATGHGSAGAPVTRTEPTRSTSASPRPTPSASPTPTQPSPQPSKTVKPRPAPPPKPKAMLELEDRTDGVRELEARLHQLDLISNKWVDGYFGTATRRAVTVFQDARDLRRLGYVDFSTWRVLRDATREPTHEQLYPPRPKPPPVSGTLDSRCMTGRVVCIDKSTRSVRWVVDGHVRLSMDARFGCQSSPTREGTFSISGMDRHGYSRMYDSRMPFAMFFSGDQAVHYSDDFAAVGYDGCSHGCVNVRNWDALSQLFDEARVGDTVVVYWS
jgi:hypothetical protein